MNWKTLARIATGYLRGIGEDKKDEDTNTTGKDDATGIIFVFISDVCDALILGKPLPSLPKEYKAGTVIK